MLLPTHYRLLVNAMKKLNFRIENNLVINNNIQLDDTQLKNFAKGLFFPDLPCAYFYLEGDELKMFVRLCSVIKLGMLGKFTDKYVSSQIEESHNGKYSLNHSMASSNKDTNETSRLNIIRRCCVLAFKYLETDDISFLGYLIHIIQDSFSPGHTFRSKASSKKVNLNVDYNDIIEKLKVLDKHEYKYVVESEPNAKTITNLVYKLLSKQENIDDLLNLIRTTLKDKQSKLDVDFSQIMNVIIRMIIDVPKSYNDEINEVEHNKINMRVLKILLGDAHKTIISDIFITKGLVMKDINYNELMINNNTKIFKDGVKYKEYPHNLTRLYKLIMNTIFSFYNIKKMGSYVQAGGENLTKHYIKLFLYYPDQDSSMHGVKDCEGILKTSYISKQLFMSAEQDTVNIMKLMFDYRYRIQQGDKTALPEAITELYNFLMN
jgi:hypothetical protein